MKSKTMKSKKTLVKKVKKVAGKSAIYKSKASGKKTAPTSAKKSSMKKGSVKKSSVKKVTAKKSTTKKNTAKKGSTNQAIGKKASVIKGVPEGLTLAKVAKWVEPRISKKRFAHVQGVVAVGQELSRLYGLNQAERFYVGLACWLHDSCKEMKDYELVEKARDLGIELTEIEKSSGHLLHGPVAARLVKKELKISNKAVLAAMAQHTLGATNMTEIAKIVYLADCLEASRPDDFTQPIWAALTSGRGRAQAVKGSIDVDKAMLVACDLSLEHLLKSRRPIHPLTVDVRNHFLGIVRAAEKLAG